MTISNKYIRKQDDCLETEVRTSDEQVAKYNDPYEEHMKRYVQMEMIYYEKLKKYQNCCNHLKNIYLYTMIVVVVFLLVGAIILLETGQFIIRNMLFYIVADMLLGISIFLILRLLFTNKQDKLKLWLHPDDTIDAKNATIKSQFYLATFESEISLFFAKLKLVFKNKKE